jgi:molecular chaperone GrpE (heat shock protein)
MSELSLKEKMTKEALNIAEEHIIKAIDDVYRVAEIYVEDTVSPVDNSILAGLKMLKGQLVKIADKIDGEQG